MCAVLTNRVRAAISSGLVLAFFIHLSTTLGARQKWRPPTVVERTGGQTSVGVAGSACCVELRRPWTNLRQRDGE